MKRIFLIIICVSLLVPAALSATEQEFSAHWYDGKAELNGYNLTISRYGDERKGSAVLIFVTEPFSRTKRVKVDNPSANPGDTFNVMKLNLVRDFQTGVYDYNTMVSVFSDVDGFSPSKVTFSSAEWCGHVYQELLFDPEKVRGHHFSYFEGESGAGALTRPSNGVAEDNLLILLRGLKGDYLEPGQKRRVKMLPSVFYSRLTHTEMDWVETEIRREKKNKKIKVPAGRFDTMVYRVVAKGRPHGTFYIEADYPHRVVKWEMMPDVSAELTGSERMAYWQLNKNGNERYLKKLGQEFSRK